MSFVSVIILIALVSVGILAFRSVVNEFRTQEGCRGCNGICLENGGYCPRKKSYHKRPPKKLIWKIQKKAGFSAEYGSEIGDAGSNIKDQVIAVCCDDNGYVSTFDQCGYFWLYIMTEDGIAQKKMSAVGGMDTAGKIGQLAKVSAETCIAARFDRSDDIEIAEAGISLYTTEAVMPDRAIDRQFEGSLMRNEPEKAGPSKQSIPGKLFHAMFKDAFKIYHGAPLATAVNFLGTGIMLATMFLIVISIILILVHFHMTTMRTMIAIAAYCQWMGFAVVSLSEKMAAKRSVKI